MHTLIDYVNFFSVLGLEWNLNRSSSCCNILD